MRRNVLIGVALTAVVVIAAAASGVHLLRLLFFAACPLSMMVMMVTMGGSMRSPRTGPFSPGARTSPSTREELEELRSELERLRGEQAGSDPNATRAEPPST